VNPVGDDQAQDVVNQRRDVLVGESMEERSAVENEELKKRENTAVVENLDAVVSLDVLITTIQNQVTTMTMTMMLKMKRK